MITLKTTINDNIDISDDILVFEYIVPKTMIVIAQVTLQNIAGNLGYNMHFYSDDILTVPDHNIIVPNGVNQAIFQSRGILIIEDSTVTIKVKGDITDVDVNTITKLIDATPLLIDDIDTFIVPIIEQTITNQLSRIEIRPTKTILGSCSSPVKSVLQPIKRTVKQDLLKP